MSAATDGAETRWRQILCRILIPPDVERTWWDVIVWWESRRLLYNALIGVAAGASLLLFFFFTSRSHLIPPGEDAVEPLALIAAPILANICYTAGWMVELMLRGMFRTRARRAGFWLMCLGVGFSLLVVAAPTLIWAFIWLTHGAR